MSRRRHSFGVTSLRGLRSSYSRRSGLPTLISVYLITSQNRVAHALQKEDELEIEVAVNIAPHFIVCLDDFLDLRLDEVIEGINVLFDQALDL
jgi:hypothetical protein